MRVAPLKKKTERHYDPENIVTVISHRFGGPDLEAELEARAALPKVKTTILPYNPCCDFKLCDQASVWGTLDGNGYYCQDHVNKAFYRDSEYERLD